MATTPSGTPAVGSSKPKSKPKKGKGKGKPKKANLGAVAAKMKSLGISDADLAERVRRSGLLLPPGSFISATGRYDQTGATTRRRDVQLKAKPPGWRISEGGRRYFENRRNRSDRNLTKRL